MAKDCSKVVIIDLEATCWEDREYQRKHSEIIEIGIVLWDRNNKEIIKSEGIFIKPEFGEVSPYCTDLTSITTEDVANAKTLKEACRYLKLNYNPSIYSWASYGDYDRKQFIKDCQKKNVRFPFSPTHINIKNLLALKMGWKHEKGMAQALETLNIPLEGTHHRGIDDAKNISKLFATLFN